MLSKERFDKYVAAGFKLVPLDAGKKSTTRRRWNTREFALTDFDPDSNIGLLPGKSDLLDVDLDCMEAVRVAPYILPDTGAMFGYSRSVTHYLYSYAGESRRKVWEFGGLLLELRGDNTYSMIPPSVHPDYNVPVQWMARDGSLLDGPLSPAKVAIDALRARCSVVAFCATLLRAWPALKGSHHEAALQAGAFLSTAQPEIEPDKVGALIGKIAELAGDTDVPDRLRAAQDSAEKQRAGEPVKYADLESLVGDDLLKSWRGWFGINKSSNNNVAQARAALAADPRVVAELEAMNVKHYYAGFKPSRVIATTNLKSRHDNFCTTHDFRAYYANKQIGLRTTVADLWLEWPGRLTYDMEDYMFGEDTPGVRDKWRGFSAEPVKPAGDVAKAMVLFLSHIHDVICSGNTEHSNYLLQLLAYKVQQPGFLSRSIPVLISGQGTGKSIMLDEYAALFGMHATTIRGDELFNRFNSWADNLVIRADEVTSPRDRYAASQRVKLLTENRIAMERKGIDSTSIQNRMLILVSSNSRNIMHVDPDDRRLFFPRISDARKNDYAYFTAMVMHAYHELPNPQFQSGLLWTLLNTPVDVALVNGKPPESDTKDECAEDSLDGLALWLRDLAQCNQVDLLSNDGLSPVATEVTGQWIPTGKLVESARITTGNSRLIKHSVAKRLNRVFGRVGLLTSVSRKTSDGLMARGVQFPHSLKAMRVAWCEEYGRFDWDSGTQPTPQKLPQQ